MIITLIAISLLIFGIIKAINESKYSIFPDGFFGEFMIYGTVGVIATIVCIIFIITSQVGTDIQIAQNNVQYESLLQRQEIVDSEYEDVSKSDVIRDIAEWNKDVTGVQYWGKNPWTSWFFNQKVVDNLKLIE